MRQSAPGRLESVGDDDDILVRQLRKIYLNQESQTQNLDRRRKFLKRWKYILCCCL